MCNKNYFADYYIRLIDYSKSNSEADYRAQVSYRYTKQGLQLFFLLTDNKSRLLIGRYNSCYACSRFK